MAESKLGVVISVRDESGSALQNAGANVQKFSDASTRAASGTDALSRAMGVQGVTMGQLVGAITGVHLGLQLVSSTAGAVKGVLSGVISTGIAFGSEMAGVGAVSGATAGQLARLGELARVGGVNIGVGAVEGARGLQELVKGGVSVESSLTGGLRATELMAKAGGVDLATAAEISAVALNSFGLSGGQLAHVADLVAGAANASSISVDDYRMSLSQVGAVARTIGFSIDDTSVAIAEMGQAGIKGSDAGTSLRTFMLRLSPTTAEATAEMRKLGIITGDGANRFFDASGQVKRFAEVSDILKTATIGLSDEQKLATLNTIFGTDAIRSASVFVREGAAGFNTLQAAMAKVGAEDVASKRLDSLGGDLDKFKARWEALAVLMAKNMVPREVVQGATGALSGYEKFLKGEEQRALALPVAEAQLRAELGDMSKLPEQFRPSDDVIRAQAKNRVNERGPEAFIGAPEAVAALTASMLETEGAAMRWLPTIKAAVFPARDIAKELDAASTAGQRLNDVIGHQISVLGRDNLSLKVQEAGIQERLLPLKEREAELALQILESTDKKTSLQMEGAALQARMNASGSSNALEDADFEQRRLQAKIKADAIGGRGVSGADIVALTKLNLAKPGLELSALMAGRDVTLAERAQKQFADQSSLAGLPGRLDQAGLALTIAQGERELGRLTAQVDAARLVKAPGLADLEAQKRALEDKMFAAAQLKADREGKTINLNIQQLISSTGEVDYDRIIQNTQTAVLDAFRKAQAADPGLPQPSFTPGSRGTGVTGPF